MFLILRLFNSFLFVLANISVAVYTLHRFFRAMKSHYKFVSEVEEYNSLVQQSRESLDFVSRNVIEAMKEMESDIGKEVEVTHNLTKLSSKVAEVGKRFAEVEEGIIELARLSPGLENAKVETPSDINEEVRRIFMTLKRKSSLGITQHLHQLQQQQQQPQQQLQLQPQQQQPQPPQPPQPQQPQHASLSPIQTSRRLSGMSRSHGAMETQQSTHPSRISKFSANRRNIRSRSPSLVPDVMLLDEQRRISVVDKPIGFRPPWMCEV